MTGSHAVGDYVVFVHGDEKLRGYIQRSLGGHGYPVAYVVRVGDMDYEVSEQRVVNG
jgi:hypothetical protein